MSFASLVFLCVFLPCSLILYALMPGKLKNPLLVILSLLFFAWGNLLGAAVLALLIPCNYLAARRIAAGQTGPRLTLLIAAALVDLAVMALLKYGGPLLARFGLRSAAVWSASLPMPALGCAFFTLSLLAFLADVYRGEAAVGSLTEFALYVSFFPKLLAGPVISWKAMAPQLRSHPFRAERALAGGRRFLFGLIKKLLIADSLGRVYLTVSALPAGQLSLVTAWIGTLSFAFMLYYDLGAYTDMAVGLGGLFGFNLPENFDRPWCAYSLTEYWRRWHCSLGDWFRRYARRPLEGGRTGGRQSAWTLLAVWILLALWHRLSWNLLLWGAYSGLLLLLEQTVLEYRLKKLPRWFRRVLTLFLIFLGWVFFFTPDPGTAFLYLHRMVGLFTVPFADRAAAYYLRSSWLVLAIALVGILPITKDLCDRVLCSRQLWLRLLAGLVFGALLYLSAAALLGGAETAFLYFQF